MTYTKVAATDNFHYSPLPPLPRKGKGVRKSFPFPPIPSLPTPPPFSTPSLPPPLSLLSPFPLPLPSPSSNL